MATRNIVFQGTITRPSNATAFAVGDVVGTNPASILTLTPVQDNAVILGQSYWIKSIRLATNNTTVTNGTFKLYFYNSAPTAIADNSPFTLLQADNSKRIGYFQLNTLAIEGAGGDSAEAYNTDVNLPIKLTENNLKAVLVAEGAYTPAAGQIFFIEVIAFRIEE